MSLERGLWPEACVAGLAALSVGWPLTTLLDGQPWVALAIVLVAGTVLTGSLLRTVGAPTLLIPLAQLVVGVLGLGFAYLPQTLWSGLPTLSTAMGAADLLADAGSVLRTYAAPAPATTGVSFLVVAVLLLTAVTVDTIGVTGRAPAVAGIPLAAAFLVSVSNSGEALEPWFFLATGGAWLMMLAQQGARSVDAWPSRDRRELAGADDVSHGRTGHRSIARGVGAFALVAAVAGAGAIPHLPPTYFAQGLARNPDANDLGGGAGQVSFVDTMDPSVDLRNQSQAPVLGYTTDARTVEPLKVTSTTVYADATWVPPDPDSGDLIDPPTRSIDSTSELSASIPTTTRTVRVRANRLQPPHLATPSPLTYLDAGADAWWYDESTGAAVLRGAPVESYTANYVTFGSLAELPDGVGSEPVPTGDFAAELAVPEEARGAVASLAADVVGQEEEPLEQAILLQNHLRGGGYLYSLTLGPTQSGVPDEPISQFLANRQGYCVQFATAMVMMARDRGIPARMAVGFLPGELQSDGSRVVVASDAHTWPELYLSDLGWTRFEPTPGIRTGPAPAFTRDLAQDVEGAPAPSADPVVPPPSVDPGVQEPTDGGRVAQEVLTRLAVVLAALGVLGTLLLLIPLAGRWYRSRELRQAQTSEDAVEARWLVLTRSLADLGVPPPEPRSPRAMHRHYTEELGLDRRGTEALGRVTGTLERVRYAPGRTHPSALDADEDVSTVVAAVRETVSRGTRLRAAILPSTGFVGIRAWLARHR